MKLRQVLLALAVCFLMTSGAVAQSEYLQGTESCFSFSISRIFVDGNVTSYGGGVSVTQVLDLQVAYVGGIDRPFSSGGSAVLGAALYPTELISRTFPFAAGITVSAATTHGRRPMILRGIVVFKQVELTPSLLWIPEFVLSEVVSEGRYQGDIGHATGFALGLRLGSNNDYGNGVKSSGLIGLEVVGGNFNGVSSISIGLTLILNTG